MKIWPKSPKKAELILLKSADMVAVRPEMSEATCCLCSHPVVVHPVGLKIIKKKGSDKVTLMCLECAIPQPTDQTIIVPRLEMVK